MVSMVFQANELAFREWLSANPQGYIVSTSSKPTSDYLVLHLAHCGKGNGAKDDAHAGTLTAKGCILVCAATVEELTDWVTEQGFDGFSKHCELCHPTGGATYRRFNWARDELILALDLYHTSPAARGNKTHPGVVELSELLQELPLHAVEFRPPNFRNCNGVAMKLSNFLVCDPSYKGAGLHQRAQLEQDIWNEFSEDLVRLRQVASSIREHYPTLKSAGIQHLSNDDGVEEGGILQAVHKSYERDASIIRKKKNDVFAKHMALKCEVCDFDFAKVYGDLGNQFAECHHTKPVAKMKPGEKTRQSDLSIVCANCHRMLHRTRDMLSIERLKAVLAKELALEATKSTFK